MEVYYKIKPETLTALGNAFRDFEGTKYKYSIADMIQVVGSMKGSVQLDSSFITPTGDASHLFAGDAGRYLYSLVESQVDFAGIDSDTFGLFAGYELDRKTHNTLSVKRPSNKYCIGQEPFSGLPEQSITKLTIDNISPVEREYDYKPSSEWIHEIFGNNVLSANCTVSINGGEEFSEDQVIGSDYHGQARDKYAATKGESSGWHGVNYGLFTNCKLKKIPDNIINYIQTSVKKATVDDHSRTDSTISNWSGGISQLYMNSEVEEILLPVPRLYKPEVSVNMAQARGDVFRNTLKGCRNFSSIKFIASADLINSGEYMAKMMGQKLYIPVSPNYTVYSAQDTIRSLPRCNTYMDSISTSWTVDFYNTIYFPKTIYNQLSSSYISGVSGRGWKVTYYPDDEVLEGYND